MGYVMIQRDSRFCIAAEDCASALAAVKALHGREPIEDHAGHHYSFVKTEEFLRAETLADALAAWRWEAEESANGSIDGLDFLGEKHGDEDLLFAALGPFVRSGSYIEMVGEDDGAIWRWVFQGKAVYKVQGTVSFETPTEAHRLDPSELTGYVRFR